MKFKKVAARKKAESPMDTMEDDFNDDECSNDGKGHSPVRNTANARERARMRVLSSAFYRLKTIIPWVPHDTKLSKLDTLRLARNYIAYLTSTLDGEPVEEITNKMPHPQKMTWPYIFHQPDAQPKKVSITQLKDDLHYVKDDYSKEMTTLSDISHKYTSSYDSFNRCNDYEMIYD